MDERNETGMTLERAIELNNKIIALFESRLEEAETNAIKLGIEALKKLKANREYGPMAGTGLLPSERKD